MKLKKWINIPIELDNKAIASAIRQKQQKQQLFARSIVV
jgi:hypothetical protein